MEPWRISLWIASLVLVTYPLTDLVLNRWGILPVAAAIPLLMLLCLTR